MLLPTLFTRAFRLNHQLTPACIIEWNFLEWSIVVGNEHGPSHMIQSGQQRGAILRIGNIMTSYYLHDRRVLCLALANTASAELVTCPYLVKWETEECQDTLCCLNVQFFIPCPPCQKRAHSSDFHSQRKSLFCKFYFQMCQLWNATVRKLFSSMSHYVKFSLFVR